MKSDKMISDKQLDYIKDYAESIGSCIVRTGILRMIDDYKQFKSMERQAEMDDKKSRSRIQSAARELKFREKCIDICKKYVNIDKDPERGMRLLNKMAVDICQEREEIYGKYNHKSGCRKHTGDIVKVIRCKDCQYYISASDVKANKVNPEDYDYYNTWVNHLGADGICTSTDTWTDETDYCSNAKKREE
nr:hypothetical protein [uncultured Mediterraneibacter sp.]